MSLTTDSLSASAEKSTTDRLSYRPLPVPSWLKAGVQVTSAVMPPAAAKLTRRLLFVPLRTRPRPEERAVLERGERFSVRVKGERVEGRTWGEGPAVLLAHGWGGNAGQMTSFVAPLVAAGMRAVAIDQPAHGESGGRETSLAHFAWAIERVTALFRPLKGIVAHSFGAGATTWALSRGLPAERAVYVAPTTQFEPFWTRFRAATGVSDAVWGQVLVDSQRWLDVRFEEMVPLALAKRMTTPLLVLHATNDREIFCSEGQELVAAWPGARMHEVEKLGHLRILHDEACVAEAVRFLRG